MADLHQQLGRSPRPAAPPNLAGLGLANLYANLRALRDARVPILAGTDAPNPGLAHGASLHQEMELLVEGGLSPIEALAAATSVPARCFGLHDRGRIAPGLRADLLLVRGDPTLDITTTRDIVSVWKGGVQLERKTRANQP
jgi:imidazolonepropionase-like amidohydrolase